jgi:uncharacterized protein YyaL (SSP411 family)
MEEECFNDDEVAGLMNRVFVSVKVDREERPDIDAAYMAVCQQMGRSCGWPLNVVMTPEKKPFFVTSYVPKISRFGLIGIMDLISQIEQLWKSRRSDLENLGSDIIRSLEKNEESLSESELGIEVSADAFEWFSQNFDPENGGFGYAPKFPSTHNLLFLLRYWNRTGEERALAMVKKTLTSMSMGGIFDQIGFGFHRYSTDAEWLVPHFEKMLYDQALLIMAYIEVFQATGIDEYKRTAEEVLEYIMKEMLSPEGGFYSSQDADSEGEEGKFYFWAEDEIKKALSPEDSNLAIKTFSVKPNGNHNFGKERSQSNILHLEKTPEQTAKELNMEADVFNSKLTTVRKTLLERRNKRTNPATDDKILTDWNGLVIAALAKTCQVLTDPKYIETAVRTSDFILSKMRNEKTLLHSYAKGKSGINGFLDDYAFLVWGLIEIYETNFDNDILEVAVDLTKTMVDKFWDEKNGGFYSTPKDATDAVIKRKEAYDGALPSGNSVALMNLLRLARLTSAPSFEAMAGKMLKVFSEEVKRAPTSHSFMLSGLEFTIGPSYSVVLVGDAQEIDKSEMLHSLRSHYLPSLVISGRKPISTDLGYEKIGERVTAYVCRGQICLPPTTSVSEMLELLGFDSE